MFQKPIKKLTLDELRATDPKLKDLSDEELLEARDTLYNLAQLALDCWVKEQDLDQKNNKLGH